jgi:hypothetical protein
MWKDTLLPGGSRAPVAVGTPGSVPDYYGTPVGRMDFVMGPNGVPVISGSSEAQPCLCFSVGYVALDSDDTLTLAQSFHRDDGEVTQWGHPLSIPKVAITRRFRVPVV